MSRDKRLNRTQEVVGSIPISSTTSNPFVGKGAPLRAERPLALLRLEAHSHEVVAPVVVDRARPEAIGIVLDDLLVRQIDSIGR